MLSRRKFMQAGAAAAAVPLVTSPRLSSAGMPDMPPSITALKSRRDEAKPITREERTTRQEKARRLMGEHKLDAILLMEGTSLNYFAGIRWWGGERTFVCIIPAKGEAFYVCPAFEEGRAREQIRNGPSPQTADVRTWQEDESPYQLIAQGLKDRGISTGTVGIEETVRYVFSDGVAKAAPQIRLASATPITAGCRSLKSDHEIALMRLAAQVTFTAYEAAYKAIRVGMTQDEFASLVSQAHTRLGFTGGADVQVGEYSANPHGSVEPQVIREGTILLMDGGCKVEGYDSDISRTFVIGRPTDKMRRVFDIVHNAQSAALQTARPGVECQAVDAAARKVITDAGFGPDYKFFTHRVGHGLGMDGHEWPYLVRGNSRLLEPNMTFSDEPGIYIRGEFGVRLEDDMHILDHGAELFTPQSQSLEDPFGKA
jgi:Xaa-Pro dipeptidase